MVNATPRPLYLLERPGIHCTGGWVCHRAGLDRCGKSRPPAPGFDPRTVQPVASRYTDWAIAVPEKCQVRKKLSYSTDWSLPSLRWCSQDVRSRQHQVAAFCIKLQPDRSRACINSSTCFSKLRQPFGRWSPWLTFSPRNSVEPSSSEFYGKRHVPLVPDPSSQTARVTDGQTNLISSMFFNCFVNNAWYVTRIVVPFLICSEKVPFRNCNRH